MFKWSTGLDYILKRVCQISRRVGIEDRVGAISRAIIDDWKIEVVHVVDLRVRSHGRVHCAIASVSIEGVDSRMSGLTKWLHNHTASLLEPTDALREVFFPLIFLLVCKRRKSAAVRISTCNWEVRVVWILQAISSHPCIASPWNYLSWCLIEGVLLRSLQTASIAVCLHMSTWDLILEFLKLTFLRLAEILRRDDNLESSYNELISGCIGYFWIDPRIGVLRL